MLLFHLLHTDYANIPLGGDSSIKMPGCVCWGSANIPILKDALGKKHTHIEGFLCILHPHIMV